MPCRYYVIIFITSLIDFRFSLSLFIDYCHFRHAFFAFASVDDIYILYLSAFSLCCRHIAWCHATPFRHAFRFDYFDSAAFRHAFAIAVIFAILATIDVEITRTFWCWCRALPVYYYSLLLRYAYLFFFFFRYYCFISPCFFYCYAAIFADSRCRCCCFSILMLRRVIIAILRYYFAIFIMLLMLLIFHIFFFFFFSEYCLMLLPCHYTLLFFFLFMLLSLLFFDADVFDYARLLLYYASMPCRARHAMLLPRHFRALIRHVMLIFDYHAYFAAADFRWLLYLLPDAAFSICHAAAFFAAIIIDTLSLLCRFSCHIIRVSAIRHAFRRRFRYWLRYAI